MSARLAETNAIYLSMSARLAGTFVDLLSLLHIDTCVARGTERERERGMHAVVI